MSDNTYNGWTNYETWCTNLWMSNDEGSWTHYLAQAREAEDVWALSSTLKAEYEEALDEWRDVIDGVWLDLLTSALGGVNWDEIAKGLMGAVSDD